MVWEKGVAVGEGVEQNINYAFQCALEISTVNSRVGVGRRGVANLLRSAKYLHV